MPVPDIICDFTSHSNPDQNTIDTQELNRAKINIDADFEAFFGKHAAFNYYYGYIKVPAYYKKDIVVCKDSEPPKYVTKEFGVHFGHGAIADDLKLNLGQLHRPFLEPYFKAVAMRIYTDNPAYSAIAADILSDFAQETNKPEFRTQPDAAPLTDDDLDRIRDGIDTIAGVMIEHTPPISFKLADLFVESPEETFAPIAA
jgi:hypothetical protein